MNKLFTYRFLRSLLVRDPDSLGSEIYGLNSLVAAVPYAAVLSSSNKLPAIKLPSETDKRS